MLSIPVIGTWVSFLVFGGPFPGHVIIGRLYIAHVLLIPGILLALIGAHLALVVRQKHTQFPGPGRTEDTVARRAGLPDLRGQGRRLLLHRLRRAAALGGLAQINPVWLFGPYKPAQVSSGSQPDWYMMFLDGSTRLFPSWEIRLWGHTLPPLFWPTVVLPGILFDARRRLSVHRSEDDQGHGAAPPAAAPARRPGAHRRSACMALTFYLVLFLSGGNDIIAKAFDISLNAMTWGGRIAAARRCRRSPTCSTYRICLGLQRHDREVLEHGIETGIIKVLPTGEFIEVHQPLGPVDEHGHGTLTYAGAPVPKRMNQLGAASPLKHVRGFFYPVKEKPEIQAALDELEAREAAALEPDPSGSVENRTRELTD